jgi:two-component system, response regulator
MSEKTVLLVEDNQDDVDLTLHCFKNNNISNKIVVVRDGAQALDYLFGKTAGTDRETHDLPMLILLDLKLPKVGGLEVLQRIRSDPRTKRLPVVILTSSKEERDRANGYDWGANSYICKPVDLDQFNEGIRQLGFYWLLLNEPPPVPVEKVSP